MKKCYKCGLEKDLNEFHKDRTTKSGLSCWCKKCKSECVKQYRLNNKELISEKQRLHRIENIDKYKEKDKCHYDKNREQILKQKSEYYLNNKDKINEYQKVWRKENKKYIREFNKQYRLDNLDKVMEKEKEYHKKNPHIGFNSTVRRRANIGNQEITKEEWKLIMESNDWKCFYCNCKLDKNNRTIDHWIPLSRGGDHATHNLLPACRTCNSSKQDKLYHEWKK